MDSDRKSTVSSFYGRKTSFDALNSDFPSATPAGRGRDDASSFFNPDRASRNWDNERFGSAGYNKGSFYIAGREEPLKGGRDEEEDIGGPPNDGWDVYADFNNTGPRYSSAFGQKNEGYHPLSGSPVIPKAEETPKPGTLATELVTVPALGPEWQRDELKDMTKSGKQEKKAEARKRLWREWNRDQRGLYGKWFTRRMVVAILFVICVLVAIILAVCIPRVPAFSFNSKTPLSNATGDFATHNPLIFSRAPANFSFGANADLQLDTNNNNVPLTFNHMFATVYDLNTGRQVATGDLGHYKVPARSFPDILLPLNFTYVASNDSDPTWNNWYNACKNKAQYIGGNRPPVQFRLVLDLDILGLPSRQQVSTQVTDADCPVELPSNSV